MHVIQIAPSLSHSTGGLFVSISSLARASMQQGVTISVFAPATNESPEDIAAWAPMETKAFPVIGPKAFNYSPRLLSALQEAAPDIVHSHGTWAFPSVAAFLWSRRTERPYMMSIHGMLEPWALQQSRIKKIIARRVYQDRVINNAACLRTTSPMETESIRRAGFEGAVAMIPNGIDLPPKPVKESRRESRSYRRALFLSRIHPKKGLLNLIEAWRQVRPPDWKLTIVGPDDVGHATKVEAAIKSAELGNEIQMVGPSWGLQRFDYYWSADLFVLPSFSENFGLVIAEALACELPVITTKGLPWSELERHKCGWWIDIGVEPLIVALREACRLSDEQRREMGAHARQLVAQNYTWESAGRRINEVYKWMVHGGSPPATICM
jgi:glycosyltransferase involved in cell wall biosynthesis